MRNLINDVKRFMTQHRMLTVGDRIVIGISGGPDSRALLEVLYCLAKEYRLTLIAAHLNHGLRAINADEDEDFVAHLCESLGVLFERKMLDIRALSKGRHKSLEEVGRDERYRFLAETAQKHGADKIALGHHRGDQAETVLMNFLRGCGVEGLHGMLPVRDGIIIRPLLGLTREEILSFLHERNLSYRSDSSNFDNVYRRNRIRNRLLPSLKRTYNPNIETALTNLAEIAQQDDAYLHDVVAGTIVQLGTAGQGETTTIGVPAFLELHEAIQRRLIKMLLERYSRPGTTITYPHVKSVLALIHRGGPSGRVSLPGSLVVSRQYEEFSVARNSQAAPRAARDSRGKSLLRADTEAGFFSYDVQIPGRLELHELGAVIAFDFLGEIPSPPYCATQNLIYLDYDRIATPLCVRNRRPGDRIQPLGMAGSKKVKSYLIDKKIPRVRREKMPLLADRESVLWVIGMGMSDRVKVTEKTKRVVRAEII